MGWGKSKGDGKAWEGKGWESKGSGGKGAWEAGGSGGKGAWEGGEWEGKGWGGGGKGAWEAGQWTWQPCSASAFADAWEYGKGGATGSAAGTAGTDAPMAPPVGQQDEVEEQEGLWHKAVGGKGSASRRADQRMAEDRFNFSAKTTAPKTSGLGFRV